jgi:hypothetical protein
VSTHNPFVPDNGVSKPGIIGARWWNAALEETTVYPRRSMLSTGLWVGGGLALSALWVWSWTGTASDDEEGTEQWKTSLEIQRDYGWNFGAVSETVAFDTLYTQTYAREALATLEKDLAPTNPMHRSMYVPTLFQSPEALPRLAPPDPAGPRIKPLAEALKPIRTPEMDAMEKVGLAYAELVSKSSAPWATLVDMPGPLAVAFAAGAAALLDPVFLFDNWPHPKGVVPSHLALAAATYYQPAFREKAKLRANIAPALFVIDRTRLSSYTDDVSQFDNRYVAKLPSSLVADSAAKSLVYVVKTDADLPEDVDLNSAFVATRSVRALAASAFAPEKEGGPMLFGGNQQTHQTFGKRYPVLDPTALPADLPAVSANSRADRYKPTPREEAPKKHLDAPGIGYVPVVVALGTGLIIGSRFNRSGSWNRTYSGGGG